MLPALSHGDFIFFCPFLKPKVGAVVVVSSRGHGLLVKRIQSISKDRVELEGDNQRLHSSICDAPIPKSSIIGRVIIRLRLNELPRVWKLI